MSHGPASSSTCRRSSIRSAAPSSCACGSTNADGLLRPNAFVEVALTPDPTQRRVRVPSEAVVSDGEESVVFVTREAGRLERTPVTVGRRGGGEVELRSGLEPGTRYVAKGALLLLNQLQLAQ